jgi:hypothetical protein
LYKFTDLTGKTFGERVVLKLSHQNPKSGSYYWSVRCSCGREDIVSGSRLKKGTRCLECSGRINGRKGLDSQAENLPCYFIKCGDYVKVGSSKEPERRLKNMRTNNPYPLELLLVDHKNNEKYWHTRLQKCLYYGEWYYYGDVCEIVDI